MPRLRSTPASGRTALAALTLSAALASGCGVVRPTQTAPAERPPVTLTILQLNDVYEITPIEAGRSGGLARVAALRQRLLAEDPDVVTVMAGDFYSPSALGTARVNGERLNGRQMVAVLNVMGLDLATFGNHEFDLSEADFLARVGESRFAYVSANATRPDGSPFPGVRRDTVLTVTDAGGTARVAFTGVVLASTPKPYVAYTDPTAALVAEAAALRADGADALVAITHLALEGDVEAAVAAPAYDLLLGGHEHENIDVRRGPDLTPIRKADANARTVWVHRLRIHPGAGPGAGRVEVASELVPITGALPDEPRTAAEVARWVEAAYAGFREAGFEPERVVATATEPLDGREASVRNRPTALAELIAESYLRAAPGAELAVYNGGSIRIDDVLPPGPVTEYDVIRVLPFGGTVLTAEIAGATLDSVLTQGVANRGSGGYLQTAGVTQAASGAWLVGGRPIEADRTYRVATSDFLLTGREAGLAYLNPETNPNVRTAGTHGDVRQAVIAELRRRYGAAD